jgi:LacI family transcriptional regulator
MKVKAKDIANALGVSKATVSLALNGKAGISDETKNKILHYKNAMEQSGSVNNSALKGIQGSIKIIAYLKHGKILQDNNDHTNNVLPYGLETIDRIAKNAGFTISITYFHEKEDDIDAFIADCKNEKIVGIFLVATEMFEEDFIPFKQLNLPMMIFDNDFDDLSSDSTILNNRLAVRMGMKYLYQNGHHHIVYLNNSTPLYNFSTRRKSYYEISSELGIQPKMVEIGATVDEIYHNMKVYIQNTNQMPSAIFSENYVISMGVMKALKDCRYNVPEDVSLVGIDEIPMNALLDVPVTVVKVLQKRRAIIAMNRLLERINNTMDESVQIVVGPEIIFGKSVKNIN